MAEMNQRVQEAREKTREHCCFARICIRGEDILLQRCGHSILQGFVPEELQVCWIVASSALVRARHDHVAGGIRWFAQVLFPILLCYFVSAWFLFTLVFCMKVVGGFQESGSTPKGICR
jgi:hypothetical protein